VTWLDLRTCRKATLLIAIVLLATEKLGRYFPGRTFWTYVMMYAIARLIIEQFRGDPRGTVFGVMSTAQAMALVLLPISAAMLLSLRRESEPRRGIDHRPQLRW